MKVYLVVNYDHDSYAVLAGRTDLPMAETYLNGLKPGVREGKAWSQTSLPPDALSPGALFDGILAIVEVTLDGSEPPTEIQQWSYYEEQLRPGEGAGQGRRYRARDGRMSATKPKPKKKRHPKQQISGGTYESWSVVERPQGLLGQTIGDRLRQYGSIGGRRIA